MSAHRLPIRIVLALAITATSAILRADSAPKPAGANTLGGSIDAYVRSAAALGFSGTLLVARGGDIILHRGYGWADRTRRVPNDTNTLFYIASLSKQFTAAAVLLLEAEGKLKTGDPIGLYVKDVPLDKAGITIHQLLTHTSGLPRFGWDEGTTDWKVMTRDEAVRGILGSRLTHAPGGRYDYQNANYILLAAIVERTSGTPFDEFLSAKVLRPAGIDPARVGLNSALAGVRDMAIGQSAGLPVGSFADRPKTWLRVGGGGMVLSVGDLYRWDRALHDGRVLPAAQRDAMFASQVPIEPNLGYGYGWEVRSFGDGRRVAFHRGDFAGYHCEFRWYSDSDTMLIVATNDEFRGESITEPLLNDIAGILRGASSPLPPVRTPEARELSRVEGDYYLPSGGWLEVRAAEDRIEIEAAGPRAAEILSDGDPGGARDRESRGDDTLELIARLKKGDRRAYRDVLAPRAVEEAAEFDTEWNSLGERMGELRSYQLISTISRPADDTVCSYVRLNFDKATTVMGYEWKGGRLESTMAGATPLPGRVIFAPTGSGEFISRDWMSGDVLRVTFGGRENGTADTVRVRGRGGRESVLSRQEARRPGLR